MLSARFDGTVVATNPTWEEILGWLPEDMIGNSFLDLVHPGDRDRTIKEASAMMEGGKQVPKFQNRYRTADGTYRETDWTVVSGSEFIHAIGRDNTQEREAAEARLVAEDGGDRPALRCGARLRQSADCHPRLGGPAAPSESDIGASRPLSRRDR
jgi:PAS domain S-box-containing protein